jgi:hypothetical protein
MAKIAPLALKIRLNYGVFGDNDFHGENYARQWRVEGRSNASGGTAGNQYALAVVGETQAVGNDAVDGGPKVYSRALPTPGLTGGQRNSATDKLDQCICQWQMSVVAVHTAEYVHDADFALAGFEPAK